KSAVSSSLGGQVLKRLLGGGASGSSGGLGALLGGGASGSSGGLGALLGGASGGGSSGGGMLGGLAETALNSFTQSTGQSADTEHHGPRGVTAQQFNDETAQQLNDEATVLIRAMINAAKADGRVDPAEQENILKRLGEVDPEEVDFLREEFARTVDVNEFAGSVPGGMEQQVYAMSVLAINLDTNPEAKYLHQLAQGLRIAPEACNQIHQQLGAPPLYS
ncbi:MAG: tellurite resistance TerB family protein, partial [Gammaproteobacteria bacterium]|nr:tellurite resistance TerB family protein [Gammaproteobacteria bacterium]